MIIPLNLELVELARVFLVRIVFKWRAGFPIAAHVFQTSVCRVGSCVECSCLPKYANEPRGVVMNQLVRR